MKTIRLLLVALAALATCFAVDTHFWQHGDRSDFESGTLKNLSLRGDGRIFLAPEFTEIFDSSTPYLWTLAADSKGNLYTAGGGTGSGSAKLFVIDRAGKSRHFRRAGRPGDPRHRARFQGRGLRRHRSRRQGL